MLGLCGCVGILSWLVGATVGVLSLPLVGATVGVLSWLVGATVGVLSLRLVGATVGVLSLWLLGTTVSLWCMGFSLPWLLLLWGTGSGVHGLRQLRCMGSVVTAHGAILEATRGASTVAASAFSERLHTELRDSCPPLGLCAVSVGLQLLDPFSAWLLQYSSYVS